MAFDNGEMGDLYEKRVRRVFHLFHLIILTRIFRVAGLADMVAIGLGIPAETFGKAGRYGSVYRTASVNHQSKIALIDHIC